MDLIKLSLQFVQNHKEIPHSSLIKQRSSQRRVHEALPGSELNPIRKTYNNWYANKKSFLPIYPHKFSKILSSRWLRTSSD